MEPKLEAKARSSQATAVREVAKSCRKSAICLDFKEGVYIYIYRERERERERESEREII